MVPSKVQCRLYGIAGMAIAGVIFLAPQLSSLINPSMEKVRAGYPSFGGDKVTNSIINYNKTIQTKISQTISDDIQGYYIRPDRIFGHLHMAKTAGTEINGELAAHFERVCGHKGYSYDAFQLNQRSKGVQKKVGKDVISKAYPGFNRGRVKMQVMDEIGYENCDYISVEKRWDHWRDKIPQVVLPMEMHVPCRSPVDHLMSQCNHQGRKFDCNATNLVQQVNKCVLLLHRYSTELEKLPNVTVKCFRPIPIDPYLDYMSQFLQRKRVETTYIHRETNGARNKSKECIWTDPKLEGQVLQILLQQPYFAFCDRCMGSENDLLAAPAS